MARHLISVASLNQDDFESLFKFAEYVRHYEQNFESRFGGKILGTYFNEPSTRTRLSFEVAMLKLGGKYVSVENGAENSSAKKGETLHDTLLTMSQMVDAIVVRHDVGNIFDCVDLTQIKVPVINAGDGHEGHPTQAILDLYTIWRKYGGIPAGLRVMLCGDIIYSRTCRSLLQALNKYNVQVTMAFPYPSMSQDVIHLIDHKKVKCIPESDIKQNLYLTDVLYMTRHQTERGGVAGSRIRSSFVLTPELASKMPSQGMILHPFPRGKELPVEVDSNPRAYYIKQMENGPYIRMAILMDCLDNDFVAATVIGNDALLEDYSDLKHLPKDIWDGVEPLDFESVDPQEFKVTQVVPENPTQIAEFNTTVLAPGTKTCISNPGNTTLESVVMAEPVKCPECMKGGDLCQAHSQLPKSIIVSAQGEWTEYNKPEIMGSYPNYIRDESCGTYTSGLPNDDILALQKLAETPGPGHPTDDMNSLCLKAVWSEALEKEFKPGFPQDDEHSYQCHDGGSANLGIYYNFQFVQNEEVQELDRLTDADGTVIIRYKPLQHQPVAPGTETGVIYLGDTADSTFTISDKVEVTPIKDKESGFESLCVTAMTFDRLTGEFKLRLQAGYAYKTRLVVCYEYEMKPSVDERWHVPPDDDGGWVPIRPKEDHHKKMLEEMDKEILEELRNAVIPEPTPIPHTEYVKSLKDQFNKKKVVVEQPNEVLSDEDFIRELEKGLGIDKLLKDEEKKFGSRPH